MEKNKKNAYCLLVSILLSRHQLISETSVAKSKPQKEKINGGCRRKLTFAMECNCESSKSDIYNGKQIWPRAIQSEMTIKYKGRK
jgi:hypothetical protein